MNHLYITATGVLVSSTILPIPSPRDGMSVAVLPDGDEQKGTWNTSTLVFDPRPVTKIISKEAFMLLFTDQEIKAISREAKTDENVELMMTKIKLFPSIDLAKQKTINAVNNLETLAVIAVGRAAEILNG